MSEVKQAEVVRGRGRPPKAVDDQVMTAEAAEAHVALKQQREFLKHKGPVLEEWYVLNMGKLIKKTVFATGVYSSYVGQIKPNTKHKDRRAQNEALKLQIKQLQSEGKLRAV